MATERMGLEKQDHVPLCIGSMTFRGASSEYLGSIPFDSLMAISLMILSGAIKFIYLSGTPLKRGSSRIRYMAFWEEANPDDY